MKSTCCESEIESGAKQLQHRRVSLFSFFIFFNSVVSIDFDQSPNSFVCILYFSARAKTKLIRFFAMIFHRQTDSTISSSCHRRRFGNCQCFWTCFRFWSISFSFRIRPCIINWHRKSIQLISHRICSIDDFLLNENEISGASCDQKLLFFAMKNCRLHADDFNTTNIFFVWRPFFDCWILGAKNERRRRWREFVNWLLVSVLLVELLLIELAVRHLDLGPRRVNKNTITVYEQHAQHSWQGVNAEMFCFAAFAFAFGHWFVRCRGARWSSLNAICRNYERQLAWILVGYFVDFRMNFSNVVASERSTTRDRRLR